jgi:Flp pilus assembly protein TadD
LGAKEHVVTIPAVLLVVWWWRGTSDGEGLTTVARREWPVLIASTAAIVVYLALRARFAHSVMAAGPPGPGLDHTSMFDRAVIMLPVSLEWLRLLFLPLQLSADYSPQHLVADRSFGLMHTAAAMTWLAVAVATWRRRDRWPAAFVGVAMFAATISVVSNVVVPLEVLLAERLLFLPSVGWALAIGGFFGAARFRDASVRRHITIVATATVVLAFAARSVGRAGVWRTNEVFFNQLLHDAPDSFRAHWAVGGVAFERGDSAIGEREMLTAVGLYPNNAELLRELGMLYASTDRYQPAIPLLERAVAIDSTAVSTALSLALALGRTERYPDALAVLDAVTRLHGETDATLVVRGDVLSQSGDAAGALAQFEELIRRAPDAWRFRILAAQASARAGRCDVARAQVDTARQVALTVGQSVPTLEDPELCR